MHIRIFHGRGGVARKLAVVGAVASVAVLTVPSVASASVTRSGMEHIRIVHNSLQNPGVIIIKGVKADGGKDYSRGNKDLAVFPDGAFTIQHPGGNFTFDLNPATCVAHISGTGNYTLVNGFGAYRGLTGSGTYVFKGIFTFGRNNQGGCAVRQGPTAEQDIVRASGPFSL